MLQYTAIPSQPASLTMLRRFAHEPSGIQIRSASEIRGMGANPHIA
jgi:hypothetical protein